MLTHMHTQVVWMAGLPAHWPDHAPSPALIDRSFTYLDELANITGLQVRSGAGLVDVMRPLGCWVLGLLGLQACVLRPGGNARPVCADATARLHAAMDRNARALLINTRPHNSWCTSTQAPIPNAH